MQAHEQLTDFEADRAARIASNKARLQEILPRGEAAAALPRVQVKRHRQPVSAGPQRRSTRLADPVTPAMKDNEEPVSFEQVEHRMHRGRAAPAPQTRL